MSAHVRRCWLVHACQYSLPCARFPALACVCVPVWLACLRPFSVLASPRPAGRASALARAAASSRTLVSLGAQRCSPADRSQPRDAAR